MQSFHFSLDHGDYVVKDDEGSELSDLDAAAREARQIIRELAASALRACDVFTLAGVQILDDNQALLAYVDTRDALSEVLGEYIQTGLVR